MELDSIVPWGRNLSEYREMFSLSENDLNKKILGCADGPASFNVELTQRGGSCLSIDPIYQFDVDQIRSRIDSVYKKIMAKMELDKDKYLWDSIRSVEALGDQRMAAMQNFLDDYPQGKGDGRYKYATLPNLELENDSFDLALCSHLLFLYSEQMDLESHISSLLCLSKIAKELRIYPLITLRGEPSPYIEPVMSEFSRRGFDIGLESVDYRFQKRAEEMLVIKR